MKSDKELYEPPRLGVRLLRWFCKERLFEEIEGDLFEYYQLYSDGNPRWKANLYYWLHLLSFFRQYALKGNSQHSKYFVMLNNHFKFSFRYLLKHPTSAFLNILSLSIGITCFLFIFIYVQGEFSYDEYHEDSDRIHRVVIDLVHDGERLPDATTPPALAPALKANLPEVEEATRLFPTWGRKYLMGASVNRQFYEEHVYHVDPNFLKIFTYDILKGDPNTMLDDPANIVLTQSTAEKYFGDEDPMGKEITLFSRNNQKKIVSGLIKDVPHNSHFRFDMLMKLHFESTNPDEHWGWYNFYTYVKLKEEAEHASFEEKLQPLYLSNNPNDTISPNVTYSQTIQDIHLNSALKWELAANNNMSNIRIFVTIGMFILLISVINYLNLTIGNMTRRAKEAGVRRTFGAAQRNLIGQFVIESVTVILISILIAMCITEFTFSQMEPFFGRKISLLEWQNTQTLLFLILVTIGIGIIAGIYPALRFSSLGEIKGLVAKKKEGVFDIKRLLLVAQFAISAIMIVGTMIVYKQLNFFKNSDMGVNIDQVLIIESASSVSDQQVFRDKINQLPFVEATGFSDGVVGGLNWTFSVGYPDQFLMNYTVVDPGYMEAMEFEFVAGRNFDPSIETDSEGYRFIVNETALEALNVPLDKVGESIVVSSEEDSLVYGQVIGVVKDFHFTNFKSEIKPYCFFYRDAQSDNLAVRMNSANMRENLEDLEEIWNEMAIGVPFESYFMDQSFAELHETEERLSKIMLTLTGLSIFIAFIGMLAIVNIVVKGRLKEVAVRKALGATTNQVVGLFTKKFLLLVLIANVIGLPIAWYVMREWLSDFAYRTNLDPALFLLALLLTVGVAYIIVGTRSFKAATSNLTDRLSDE